MRCALTAPSGIAAQSGLSVCRRPVIPEFDRQTPARDDVPAHIAVVDGAASLEREGRREALEENTLLLAGDRIRTERGRVEVIFDDGSVLDVDEFTSMDLLSDSLMRLTAGRIRLAITRVTNTLTYRIDAAGTTSWIANAGEYRVAIRDGRATTPEVELSVFRGVAELETTHGTTLVRTGAQAFAVSTSAPSQSYAVNVAIVDDFDRWTENLRNTRLGDDSARYLPPELSYYGGELDESGSWGYEADYGAVWYPRVDVGWRPYNHGRWNFYGSFGWTWVGGPRWAWPTHHYGRWGYSNKLVLDSGTPMGAGICVLGLLPRLCELVPARLLRVSGDPDRARQLLRGGSVGRMERRALAHVRPRVPSDAVHRRAADDRETGVVAVRRPECRTDRPGHGNAANRAAAFADVHRSGRVARQSAVLRRGADRQPRRPTVAGGERR